MPKSTKMEPKGSQNEARDLPKHPLGNRVGKVMKKGASREMKWTTFSSKIEKNTIQKIIKNQSPKNMRIDGKKVPKWSQNQWKNTSKINAKTGRGKDEEHHGNSCFSDV